MSDIAKITEEQYREMTLNEINGYINEHPSEGFRVSKLYAKSSGEAMDVYANYLLDKVKELAVPSILKEKLVINTNE